MLWMAPLTCPRFQYHGEVSRVRFQGEIGHEEVEIYGRADHRVPEASESGVAVKDLGRKHGFSDAAFYKWRGKFGGMDVSEARRLRQAEEAAGRGDAGHRGAEGSRAGKTVSPQPDAKRSRPCGRRQRYRRGGRVS